MQTETTQDTETILKVQGIGKHYQGFIALQNVSFTLNKGDVFGLLGRNGGGKTTLIKILTSLISDYHGEVEFLGHNLKEKQKLIFFKQHIAYLPDKDFLYTHMNGRQSIAFFKDFFADFCEERALEIFELFQISPTQKIGTMSKGQAEKLALALMLAREAKLYLFDEPLAGADVISRDEIFRVIGKYCVHGASIIATHLISSVEAILNKALFLNTRMMAYGSKEELCYGFNSLEESFRYYAADTTIKPLLREQHNRDSHNTMNQGGDSSLAMKEGCNVDSQSHVILSEAKYLDTKKDSILIAQERYGTDSQNLANHNGDSSLSVKVQNDKEKDSHNNSLHPETSQPTQNGKDSQPHVILSEAKYLDIEKDSPIIAQVQNDKLVSKHESNQVGHESSHSDNKRQSNHLDSQYESNHQTTKDTPCKA